MLRRVARFLKFFAKKPMQGVRGEGRANGAKGDGCILSKQKGVNYFWEFYDFPEYVRLPFPIAIILTGNLILSTVKLALQLHK